MGKFISKLRERIFNQLAEDISEDIAKKSGLVQRMNVGDELCIVPDSRFDVENYAKHFEQEGYKIAESAVGDKVQVMVKRNREYDMRISKDKKEILIWRRR